MSRALLAPLLAPLRPSVHQAVVVGLSGGADSVALLRALLEVRAEVQAEVQGNVIAAHFDHALRPDSARDAVWVGELASGLGVPFQTVRVDVASVAEKRGWNLEDAARRLRYDFLTRTAKQTGASVILTAHTRRDQAETVLTQLMRGEAILNGIPAHRGRVRRPWLHVPRADIERYLRELGQAWLDDPTNTDTHHNRAWIRQHLMPVLQARYPAVEEALGRLAQLSREDDAALAALASQITPHTPLAKEPPALLRRWGNQALKQAGVDAHTHHIQTITHAIHAGETQHLTLPGGQEVTVTDGQLHLNPPPYPGPDFPIPNGWEQRFRQDGDRITLPGGTRKISDVFTDLKIPRAERGTVPLLVKNGGEVQWIGLQPPIWAVNAWEAAGEPVDPLDHAMRGALNLAREAAQAGEVPVGAVVMDARGEIIGRGRNTSRQHADMTRHAELHAIREAAAQHGAYLTGCTLVVTLEPCPMCLGAALEARVGRIVYGASNPRAGALGGVTDLLKHHWGHTPEIQGGYRAKEAAKLLKNTFQTFRNEPTKGQE